MVSTPNARRIVRYASLEDFKEDLACLRGTGVTTVGGWSFAQILDHLASAMTCSIDGFPFRANWFIRVLLAPLMKNSLLTRPMKSGYRLPRRAREYLPDEHVTTEEALERVDAALDRLDRETPCAAHPFLGRLAGCEWIALHLRHAELHMSFVVPVESESTIAP